eukprot:CAMPEP_0184499286 /NCGR_PEP_ID=MMETSP0113_2-20130426/41084_1 /TAXON_ID=91329 /ORGANISM="Norrisiella sphaerica, Strain BC52" /LENGTH=183 /DNA_ID=CAMNT_0026887143 /DNA_START=132 /DNA_END=683 /DNA_ORIENTATION=+
MSSPRVIARGLKRFYYSSECRYVYLVLIAVNVMLIGWTLSLPGGYDGGSFFLVAQVLVNAVLVGEVAMRYIGSPENFWDEGSNVFDMFVMILGVATQLLYVTDPLDYGVAEEGALAVRIFRDGFQFLRLGVFLKNRAKSEPYHLVDFQDVDEFGTIPARFHNDTLLDEACAEVSDDSSGSSDF